MSKEGQLGQDQSHASSKEHGDTHKESAGSTLSLSHEQLVKGFRDYIQQDQQARSPKATETAPVYIIHEKLSYLGSVNVGQRKSDFWWPINKAWDALAYSHYKQTSLAKHAAGLQLSGHYRRTRESVIKLSDPQVRILDALTEAVGIPHKRGQAEIEIPQEARGYEEWLAKAESQRNK